MKERMMEIAHTMRASDPNISFGIEELFEEQGRYLSVTLVDGHDESDVEPDIEAVVMTRVLLPGNGELDAGSLLVSWGSFRKNWEPAAVAEEYAQLKQVVNDVGHSAIGLVDHLKQPDSAPLLDTIASNLLADGMSVAASIIVIRSPDTFRLSAEYMYPAETSRDFSQGVALAARLALTTTAPEGERLEVLEGLAEGGEEAIQTAGAVLSLILPKLVLNEGILELSP